MNGFPNPGCDGCHSQDGFDGDISLEFDGELTPEEPTRFTLTIRESQMTAAGFYVLTEDRVGAFTPLEGTSARLISETDLVHSRPNPATDGAVSIDFDWAPPATAGGTNFLVFVVAANVDRTNMGDRASAAAFTFTWGCDPITLYRDIDGDGYGGDGEMRPDCAERVEWSSTPGDCNDLWASIHPDAAEIGNAKDDNCNGEVDEGIDTSRVYPDIDGDGYGDALAEAVSADPTLTDYVPNAEDCNDGDATVHPGAEEICDGLDNDCNAERDEGTYQYCGVGVCSRRVASCEQACLPGDPQTELCNGLDDDCNGTIDEGPLCPEGQLCLPIGCVIVDETVVDESTTDAGAPAVPATTPDASNAQGSGAETGDEVVVGLEPSAAPDAISNASPTDEPSGAASKDHEDDRLTDDQASSEDAGAMDEESTSSHGEVSASRESMPRSDVDGAGGGCTVIAHRVRTTNRGDWFFLVWGLTLVARRRERTAFRR